MGNIKVYKAGNECRKDRSAITVESKKKGHERMVFKCCKTSLLVIDEFNDEVRTYNRFSGRRLSVMTVGDGKSYVYKIGNSLEKNSLYKQIEEVNDVSLNFFGKFESDLKDDYPEIIKASQEAHKKRFSHVYN